MCSQSSIPQLNLICTIYIKIAQQMIKYIYNDFVLDLWDLAGLSISTPRSPEYPESWNLSLKHHRHTHIVHFQHSKFRVLDPAHTQ